VITQLVTLQIGSIVSTTDRSLSRSLAVLLGMTALAGGVGFFSFVTAAEPRIEINSLDYIVLIDLLLTSTVIGWRAVQLDSPFPEIRRKAIALATVGGTSFRAANLTEANFSQAELKHTDFRKSNLSRTYWYQARGLEFARVESTYLAEPKIRQLVVTLNGQAQNFEGLNLKGVNLRSANLRRAGFAGVSLEDSNLQNADLSGAMLKQAQLDGSDLSGANLRESVLVRANLTDADLSQADLTGACIKDWSVNPQTSFVGVVCDYVYREYKNNQPSDRYPSDRNFQPGEFESLFQKLSNAVELIFKDQVDWRSLSFAFEKFKIEDDGMGLELKGVEQRGGYWVVKVTHGEGVSRQQVERQVQGTYDELRALMEAKDQQIHQLLGIVDNQTRAMGQQAEALTHFSQHPFGNNFFISGSNITNLAGSGQIEYQEAADRVRSLVAHPTDPALALQRLASQLSDRDVATTTEGQTELIQQILLNEAAEDPEFRQFLLQQRQQIIEGLSGQAIAGAVQSAIAQLRQ
ncbi:MAG: pentapeptide repeat-containing protein, partial [Phormidesmis sp.]